jgi:hypothetical protein
MSTCPVKDAYLLYGGPEKGVKLGADDREFFSYPK